VAEVKQNQVIWSAIAKQGFNLLQKPQGSGFVKFISTELTFAESAKPASDLYITAVPW